jgi:hypothetical protein
VRREGVPGVATGRTLPVAAPGLSPRAPGGSCEPGDRSGARRRTEAQSWHSGRAARRANAPSSGHPPTAASPGRLRRAAPARPVTCSNGMRPGQSRRSRDTTSVTPSHVRRVFEWRGVRTGEFRNRKGAAGGVSTIPAHQCGSGTRHLVGRPSSTCRATSTPTDRGPTESDQKALLPISNESSDRVGTNRKGFPTVPLMM